MDITIGNIPYPWAFIRVSHLALWLLNQLIRDVHVQLNNHAVGTVSLSQTYRCDHTLQTVPLSVAVSFSVHPMQPSITPDTSIQQQCHAQHRNAATSFTTTTTTTCLHSKGKAALSELSISTPGLSSGRIESKLRRFILMHRCSVRKHVVAVVMAKPV